MRQSEATHIELELETKKLEYMYNRTKGTESDGKDCAETIEDLTVWHVCY